MTNVAASGLTDLLQFSLDIVVRPGRGHRGKFVQYRQHANPLGRTQPVDASVKLLNRITHDPTLRHCQAGCGITQQLHGFRRERKRLSTAIDLDDTTASLDQALEVSPYFELEPGRTQRIAKEVAQAVALWRNEAAALGLTSAEIDRMSSAFEHDDLKAARRGS